MSDDTKKELGSLLLGVERDGMKNYVLRFCLPLRGEVFLKGPYSPSRVRKYGYGVTALVDEAWPFATRKQAENKLRILNLHFGIDLCGEALEVES